jgi:hypothetical protein
MATNINPETGIPYGVISCHNLDSEIVDMIERNGDNVSEREAEEQFRSQINNEIEAGKLSADLFTEEMERRIHEWHECSGEHVYRYVEYDDDGKVEVEIHTGWLGGAQLLFVIRSPFLCFAPPCSPCVPNAGDLDNRYEGEVSGAVTCYDVPPEWRADAERPNAEAEQDAEFDEDGEMPEFEEPESVLFEIQLEGFDGATDLTDDKIVWVAVTGMDSDALEEWLRERGVRFVMVEQMEHHPDSVRNGGGLDFDLPEEEQDFLSQVLR